MSRPDCDAEASEVPNVLPPGADAAVALTFDFDADVGRDWRSLHGRLTTISEYRYGAVRGVPRLLDVLARHDVPATFYVPGEIAERYPDQVRAIDAAGHAVGHHGHVHLFNDQVGEREQREEFERGLEALSSLLGRRPDGYRSPGWELTPYSLELLLDAGVRWDSSLMGDDRPYLERAGERGILELPVHWSLDDWVYFGFRRDALGHMSDARAMERIWLDEFESARRDRRLVTYTLHPECSGRGYRALALERMIDAMRDHATVWFASHAQIADAVEHAAA